MQGLPHRRIVVINPNSLQETTAAIEHAVTVFSGFPLEIVCKTSHDGPPGIQTQSEADDAVAPLVKLATQTARDADAIVIACFSDPGLHGLRERLAIPVLGIGESAMLVALATAQRIGVIAIAEASIVRHHRYFSAMGIIGRLAGERALNMQVRELADVKSTQRRLIEVGRQLKEIDGAGVLVLGCAGMASLRAAVEDETGLPVVEPTQAAVSLAIGRMRLC
ncbi:MAG: aspartate/glutamate racemase family protein [Burkholderiales bacterium]|nr:aspartate/glutamate racemase family protein [Burkholderiales bacterium]